MFAINQSWILRLRKVASAAFSSLVPDPADAKAKDSSSVISKHTDPLQGFVLNAVKDEALLYGPQTEQIYSIFSLPVIDYSVHFNMVDVAVISVNICQIALHII